MKSQNLRCFITTKRNNFGQKAARIIRITLLGLSLVIFSARVHGQQATSVKVYEAVGNNSVTYHYRVINSSEYAVIGLRVGFDYLHGVPELSTLPLGWTFEGGLPAGSAASPVGWQVLVVTTEESPFIDIEWSSDSGPQGDIAPGATGIGFRITVPTRANEYKASHYDLILSNSTHLYGLLQPDTEQPGDTTAPTIDLSLSPSLIWPPNHKMVPVTVSISVIDDTDPHPVVRLQSIICSEAINPILDIEGAQYGTDDREFSVRAERTGKRKEGRVYTVTYSAMDAAGNTATATSTITIPHDQRK